MQTFYNSLRKLISIFPSYIQLQRSLIWLNYAIPYIEAERLPCLSRGRRPVGPDIVATINAVRCLADMLVHVHSVELISRAYGGLQISSEQYRHLQEVMQCAAAAAAALSGLVRKEIEVER